MRLWHKDLIPVLPRKQLLGQWLECCERLDERTIPNSMLFQSSGKIRLRRNYKR